MSSLAFITVTAKVRGEAKSYEWVVKSTPREANRFPLLTVLVDFDFMAHQGKAVDEYGERREGSCFLCNSDANAEEGGVCAAKLNLISS